MEAVMSVNTIGPARGERSLPYFCRALRAA
jgi:hypothetical protein